MNTKSLQYFSLPDRMKILSGIFVRKIFGPKLDTIKLLDNKFLIERVIQEGGSVSKTGDKFVLSFSPAENGNYVKFFIRKSGADGIIYKDIILRGGGDYSLIPVLAKRLGLEIKTVIDAGANIGTATGYLKTVYPEAKIVCIEPEPGNFAALKNNIKLNDFEDVILCQNAFWINNDEVNIGIGIRGTQSKELSFGIVDDSENSVQVKGLTFSDCLEKLGTDTVDLLKIDIEGAEAALLDDENGFSLMIDRTKLLAIELHEEAIDIFKFYSRIQALGMKHIQKGETTYCWR